MTAAPTLQAQEKDRTLQGSLLEPQDSAGASWLRSSAGRRVEPYPRHRTDTVKK